MDNAVLEAKNVRELHETSVVDVSGSLLQWPVIKCQR